METEMTTLREELEEYLSGGEWTDNLDDYFPQAGL